LPDHPPPESPGPIQSQRQGLLGQTAGPLPLRPGTPATTVVAQRQTVAVRRRDEEDDGPVWDEMVTGSGRLRPHWSAFMAAHGPFDPESMAARWDIARRLLFQNGVTYIAYGDPKGLDRPWPLDPIPFLLPLEEWRAIEAGLAQRARLLERVLDDLYGAQTLLRDGILPPPLLHADPGFLRPCHGVPLPEGSRLLRYAADLVRGPDGRWRVLANRTQSPAGVGYTLENRIVMNRCLPDAFRLCNVERLAPYFERMRESLVRIAPAGSGDNPRLVLLTPGPYNEAYFEHAFLARYLGLTLAEGADLTVRDRTVYLKTLTGLDKVDVIMRRVDDAWCDPLEFRSDSTLGVPGLMEAVRAGTVAVANSLGSGLTDSAALVPYMPTLARTLLGEDLLMEDVPTYWGGREADRAYMAARLDRLLLRPAFSGMGSRQTHGPDLAQDELAELKASFAARPGAWAAQDIQRPSTAPVWRDGKLEARPIVLRVFMAADGDEWIGMPGGLARVSADSRYPAVSLQDQAGAKDCWVMAPAGGESGGTVAGTGMSRANRRSPPPGPEAASPDRTMPRGQTHGDRLPSRAADHLFWCGRYADRAELYLRLLRAANSRIVDDSRPGATEELVPLLRLFGWLGLVPAQIASLSGGDSARGMRQAIEIASFDASNPNALRATVHALKRSASGVRDRLSPDAWRVLAVMERQVTVLPPKLDPASLAVRFDKIATAIAALAGLEHDAMTRGPGWRFLVLGRRLERAVGLMSCLQGCGLTTEMSVERPALEVMLELTEAQSAYRDRHGPNVRRGHALALILADGDHPRSLAYQLAVMVTKISALPSPMGASGGGPTADALALAREALALAQNADARKDAASLRRLVEHLQSLLPDLSNLLSQAYFSHAYARAT
jgi:uncharacterized circularly permuted ATP-grasp superfamily protein/uncharacterized alpha-E superfamily protein